MRTMQDNADTRRPPGRPRDARADRAIVDATLELIAAGGVGDLRMEDVARRAGVGKAAIYRRYASKEELVADAVAALVEEITIPDTGSTRDDLVGLMRGAVTVYNDPLHAGVMRSLAGTLREQSELAHAIQQKNLTSRREALRAVLDRGVERGDLRADLDVELALDVLAGPLFYRLFITGGPLDEQLVDGIADLILRGFAPLPKEQDR